MKIRPAKNTKASIVAMALFSACLVCLFHSALAQVGLSGEWNLIANKSQGKITITNQTGSQFSGKVFSEELTSGTISGNKVTFTRMWSSRTLRQDYVGTLTVDANGMKMAGTFSQNGSGSYNWTATKVAATVPGKATPVPVPSAGSKPGATLRAESRKAKPGETITLPIWLDKVSGIADMNFNVNYDSSVVRVSRTAKGGFFTGGTLFESNQREGGVVRIGFADRNDLSGTGPVAQITFQAIGKAGGRSPIRLQVTTASGASGTKAVVKTIDGQIEILAPGGGIPGDANGNGTLDAGDALDALKMSVRTIAVNLICDVDDDRQVTSTDARLILQKVVGR